MARVEKIKEIRGKGTLSKEDKERLKGTVVIINPEKSEIAEKLEIKEKGVFGIVTR